LAGRNDSPEDRSNQAAQANEVIALSGRLHQRDEQQNASREALM
jgi:hypothetical protein